MIEPKRCPVCASDAITLFLQRGQVPAHQNMVVKDRHAAVAAVRGELSLVVCEMCGFVFNQAFDPARLTYDQSYDNTQSFSPFFDAYMDELVQHVIYERAVQHCRIVEVGCGKGAFLRKLVGVRSAGNTGYGFDPSYAGPDTDLDGRLRFERRYYGPDSAHIQADVVICRHVIEHVPDPLALLQPIRQALLQAPQARVFFETPCVDWILRNQVIWDFFYEHCSYFTARSLTTTFEIAGFRVEQVDHVFGGQYLWLEATVAEETQDASRWPGATPQLARQFALADGRRLRGWKSAVAKLAARKGIALWGAGAKGVTFANLVDADCVHVACVVDMNPHKQGQFIPGTGHPIVDYRDLPRLGVSAVLLMNPNYREEIVHLLSKADLDIEVVDTME